MRTLATGLTVLMAVALIAAPGLAQEQSSWSFGDVQTVELDGLSGDVIVEPAAGTEVTVDLRYDVRPADAFRPEVEIQGGVLRIDESWHGRNTSGEVVWTLGVPTAAPGLSIDTVSGDLSVDGVEAAITFDTASGDVTIRGATLLAGSSFDTASGSFRLTDTVLGDGVVMDTASGDVELRGVNARGAFEFDTASGDVRIEDSRGILSGSSASGDVTIYDTVLDGPAKFSSASGDVTVQLSAAPGAELDLSSASGNVIIRMAAAPTADLEASSASGDVRYEAPLPAEYTLVLTAREDRGEIRSPLEPTSERTYDRHEQTYVEQVVVRGGGAPRIDLSTASGVVEVREDS